MFGPPTEAHFPRAVALISASVAVVAFAVLIGGWVLGSDSFLTVVDGAAAMKPLSALGLMAAAGALWLTSENRRPGLVTALLVLTQVIGLLALVQFALGIEYGRPAPVTGVSLIMVAVALRLGRAEPLTIPVISVGAISLVGYAYAIPAFTGTATGSARMALHESAAFLLLGVGVLLARPSGRLVRLLRASDPGGVLFRRLGPLVVALPVVLGWLQVRVVQVDLLSGRVAAWWIAAMLATVLVTVIWLCARSLSRADEVRRGLEDELAEQAAMDPLTGLANRRTFEHALGVQYARAQRNAEPGVLMVIDLDSFKAVNDGHGHQAGDRLLVEIAQTIDERVRRADVRARIGGDEFAIILPHTDVDGARCVAVDLIMAIRGLELDGARSTISVGLAEIGPSMDVLGDADAAMYAAKRAGGDRYVIARTKSVHMAT